LFAVLNDIFPLGSAGSVNPNIFAYPDSESQNVVDPTDPDPKHCQNYQIFKKMIYYFRLFQVVKCHDHIELLVNSGGDLLFFRKLVHYFNKQFMLCLFVSKKYLSR